MRVYVNGRLPLIKSSVIEYSNGDEVTATFVYEGLQRHCSFCNKLDHEVRDCLEAKHQGKALLTSHEEATKREGILANAPTGQNSEHSLRSNLQERPPARREQGSQRAQGISFNRALTDNHSYGPSRQRRAPTASYQRGHPGHRQEWQPRNYSKTSSRGDYRNDHGSYRGDSHRKELSRDQQIRHERNRDDGLRTPSNQHVSPREESSFSRNRQLPSERGVPLRMCNSELEPETVDPALSVIKDTMSLYTKCADPSESAARKEYDKLRRRESWRSMRSEWLKTPVASLTLTESRNWI
ncbi:Clat_adaptor_s domain-containing protein [Raphanus sativus]|nr:Clat_adaptor_s domain-containing protein [Raphanus sativus]